MINRDLDRRICQWIEGHREEILKRWLELCAIPSVKSEAAPHAPFGLPCAAALKKAVEMGEAMGLKARLEADDGYGLLSLGEGEDVIGVFGHSDVVPAGDGWIYTDPFTPLVRDGVVIGRGVSDNKSGVVSSLFAAVILKELEIPLHHKLQVFVGSNEESGMEDITAFTKKEKMPVLSLVPDSSYPCSLGEKGILHQWYKDTRPLQDILDFSGGNAFNVVLDFVTVRLKAVSGLSAELRAAAEGNAAYTIREEDQEILLTAEGASKHAAGPEGSVNASVLAAKLLLQCPSLSARDREAMSVIVDFLEDFYGNGMGIGQEEEGFGKLTAANGMVKVENGHLQISLDIRYGSRYEPRALEADLDSAWTARGFESTFRNNRPGFKVDPESTIPALLAAATTEITGIESVPYYAKGGTYSRYLKNSFTIGSSAAVTKTDAIIPHMPKGHGSAHQRDEFCIIDRVFQGIRLLCHCIILCDDAMKRSKK